VQLASAKEMAQDEKAINEEEDEEQEQTEESKEKKERYLGFRRTMDKFKSEQEGMIADSEAMKKQGNAYFTFGCYTQAMKGDPRNPTLYINRGAALARVSKWEDCVKDTQTVVALMPNNRKAMVRHKAVVDYLSNFNDMRNPGYDRQNITIANLLTPEEFTCHDFTERANFKQSLKPAKVRTLTDPVPKSFYEGGAPSNEPLKWARERGSRYFWETQGTSPEARAKHRSGGMSTNPGTGWTVNPEPTVIRY